MKGRVNSQIQSCTFFIGELEKKSLTTSLLVEDLLTLSQAETALAKEMFEKVDEVIALFNQRKAGSSKQNNDLDFLIFCASWFKEIYSRTSLSKGTRKSTELIAKQYDFRQLVIDFIAASEELLPIIMEPSLAINEMTFSFNPLASLMTKLKAPVISLEKYNGRSKTGIFLLINPTSYIFSIFYDSLIKCLLSKKGLELFSYSVVHYFGEKYLSSVDISLEQNMRFYLRFNRLARGVMNEDIKHETILQEVEILRQMLVAGSNKMFKHDVDEAKAIFIKENKAVSIADTYLGYMAYYREKLLQIEQYCTKPSVSAQLKENMAKLSKHAEHEQQEVASLIKGIEHDLSCLDIQTPAIGDLINTAREVLLNTVMPMIDEFNEFAQSASEVPQKHSP